MKMKKWLTKENMIVVILVGVLCMVVVFPTGEKKEGSVLSQGRQTSKAEEEASPKQETMDYKRMMEQEVEGILQRVEGVKKAEVMLTLESSWEEKKEKSESVWDNTGENVTALSLPRVQGALVVVQCSNIKEKRTEITQAMMCLFHLDAHQITVIKMKED